MRCVGAEMGNPQKDQEQNGEGEADILELDGRFKIRLGKGASWTKWLLGLGTIASGSFAVGQMIRRLLELWQ